MKTNPNAVRPTALFDIKQVPVFLFESIIIKMVHMLAVADIDIYGSEELQKYVGEFNDDIINDPVDGMLYDIVIFNPTDFSNLNLAKPEAFIISLSQGDSSTTLLHLLDRIIFILIRQQQFNYDPSEIIQINDDLLPGMEEGVKNRLVSAYAIQLKYVLRVIANLTIDTLRQVKHKSILFSLGMEAVDSEAYQKYLSMGKEEVLIPWADYDDLDTPPWKVDSPDICWDCEHNRLGSCPLGNNPNIVSGQCTQWTTNPVVEYGTSPKNIAVTTSILADISKGVGPWDRPGAILDPIPDFGDGIHSRGLGG